MANEKKRKRTIGDESSSSSKKRTMLFQNDTLKLKLLKTKNDPAPVLAVPMGVAIPHHPMTAYREAARSKVQENSLGLLLHSSNHPRMDFTATEEFGASADKLLSHYIGIYDPKTGEMEMIKAKKMAVRTSLRPSQKEIEEKAKKKEYQTMLDQRQALGMEFGTKKSKNMIRARNENAIISSTSEKQSAATKALLASVALNIADMPTMEDLQKSAEASKPRPRANASATTPEDVYPLSVLIPQDVLKRIKVDDWIEATTNGEGVSTTSRYVSRRIASTVQSKDENKIKVLKYMLMVIEWFQKGKSGRNNARRPPRGEELESMGHPRVLLNGIAKRFVSENDNMLDAWSVDNLQTHIMAMALYMDDYNVDLEDIKDDFRLTPQKAVDLFRSLGCKVTGPTEREKVVFKMGALEFKNRKFARLTVPPDFPVDRMSARKPRGN